MRKTLFAIATILVTSSAYAQKDSSEIWSESEKKDLKDSDYEYFPDGYLYQNGKMTRIKDGKMTAVQRDVKLSNGTAIRSNGSYLKKGGTNMKFNEGEHMDMSGRIMQINNTGSIDEYVEKYNQKDWNLRSDSTQKNRK